MSLERAIIEQVALADVTLSCQVVGKGPVVIAAHGFPDDATTFAAQIPALIAAGYKVVVPTMRGYAPSEVPRSNRYDVASLGSDLLGLAQRFSPEEPVRLLGHDWGALASFAAAAMAPTRFSHLASIATPHLRGVLPHFLTISQLRRSWYIAFFQLRGIAEAHLRKNNLAFIDALWRRWSPDYHPSMAEMERVKAGIRERVGPVLSYYRALLSPHSLLGRPRKLLMANTRVKTLLLHGENDGCVGIECTALQERCYDAPFAMHRIEGAGHFLHRERPEAVNRLLRSFFAQDGKTA